MKMANKRELYEINMKMVIQIADKPNKNNRIYPKELLIREAKRWMDNCVKDKKSFIDKKPGTTDLSDVVGIINNIGMERDNLVIDAEPLKDIYGKAINGSDLVWKFLKEGLASIRMSGIGTLNKQENGTYVVGDDWELVSFFVTNDPA